MKNKNEHDDFLFAVAKTEVDKQSIFSLRYNVYIDEMNRNQQCADHKSRIIKEAIDDSSTLLMAIHCGRLVGSSRITCHHDYSLLLSDYYMLEKLLDLGDYKVSEGTKLIVRKSFRRPYSFLGRLMVQYGYKILRKLGVSFDFLNANLYLEHYYAKYGYKRLGENFIHPELQDEVVPMVLILEDIHYLQSIDSPLYDIAVAYPNRTDTTEIAKTVYPLLS